MRVKLTLIGLLLLAVVAGVLFWRLQPDPYADYVIEKKLAGERVKDVIIWHAIPIEKAYKLASRRRTPFQPNRARMPQVEADYLNTLFALTDAALAERVSIEVKLKAGQRHDRERSNYRQILDSLRRLDTPTHLIPTEALIFRAVSGQRSYIESWVPAGPNARVDPGDPLVQNANKSLAKATEFLLKLYPGENPETKQAFQDHLSALDFL